MHRIHHITAEAQIIPLPDSFFWYTLSLVLFVFVIWVVKRWLDNNKDTFDNHGDLIRQVSNCVIELTTITKVHEVQIQELTKKVDAHNREIDALRDIYIVRYNNGK